MKVTLEMIEATRRAEYNCHYRRGRLIGHDRLILAPDPVVRAVEAAFAQIPDDSEAVRLKPARFSLTGAAPTQRCHRRETCAPRQQAKNALEYQAIRGSGTHIARLSVDWSDGTVSGYNTFPLSFLDRHPDATIDWLLVPQVSAISAGSSAPPSRQPPSRPSTKAERCRSCRHVAARGD
jgi:hypothetical protein